MSDRELNKVVSNICETMSSRHGDSRAALKRTFSSTPNKSYVTKGDVNKLFREYGYSAPAGHTFKHFVLLWGLRPPDPP